MTRIPVQKTTASRLAETDFSDLRFGDKFADHMLEMRYTDGQWGEPSIRPYAPIQMTPAASILHYGQGVFEGMKAFRREDGRITIFRIDKHFERFNNSCKRLNIPEIPFEVFEQGLIQLVDLDREWIPKNKFKALYIRPFVIASDEYIGLNTSQNYRFFIISGPVGNYYREGINPIKLTTMPDYVRAVEGGVGFAKIPGNYAASLLPTHKAKEMGYTQVLWLDAKHRKYVEEVGSMNMFFVVDGKILTAPLSGTILPGVTRDCVIQLGKEWGIPVEERPVSIDELIEANKNGTLEEAFGSGTAAVISPVGLIHHKGYTITLDQDKMGPIAQRLYDTITSIHHGLEKDNHDWCTIV